MHNARRVSVVLALVLVSLTLLAPPSSTAAAKPRHEGFALGKELGQTNKFVAYGKWSTYKGKTIKVQRRNCGSCAWKFYKRTTTSKKSGWFRTRIEPGRKVPSKVCYRVVVPGTTKYRLTRDLAGCITTTRS